MKKITILICVIPFFAASCNVIDLLFDSGGGARGIFRSDNAGQTYSAGNKVTPDGNISGLSVNSLAFDPSNPATIYLGGANGVYKTEDYGNNWRYILSNIIAADVAIDPSDTNIVYVAGIVGQNGKIIKSIDGGRSWVDIYNEPSKNNTVLTVATAGSSGVVLAGLFNGEILRSFDEGRTWQASQDLADRVIKIRYNGGTAYALGFKKGLFKTNDDGLSWTNISGSVTENTFTRNQVQTAKASTFYDLSIDRRQTGVIYLGTEQGLFRTVNDGTDWAVLKLPVTNTSLKTSAVAVDPNNSNNVFATVGGTVFKTTNGGITWETRSLPTANEIRSIIINPNQSNILYLGVATPRK